jgi:hypothetical protein
MTRRIVARWQNWAGDSLEHLVLRVGPDGATADSAILGTAEGDAFAARYHVACDRQWRVRTAAVHVTGVESNMELASDGAGHWRDGAGNRLPELDGAIDIDIAATPFTNTLPIRRLGLGERAAAEIVVAYVWLPELRVTAERQRYTCLDNAGRYRFESLDGGFMREIEVDADGLVVTYPGLFRRVR